MTGKQLYEVQREAHERFVTGAAHERTLPPWEDLHPAIQAKWDRDALEQTERDHEAALAALDTDYDRLGV
jgi:hypothetical protein